MPLHVLLRRSLSAAVLALALALVPAAGAQAAGTGTPDELSSALGALASRLTGSLSASERAGVHARKRQLIAEAYADEVRGVPAAAVLTNFDCVATELQRARAGAARTHIAAAGRCRDKLAALASGGLKGDLAAVKANMSAIAARARAGRSFGSRATAVRKRLSSIVRSRFGGEHLHNVSFAETYDDLECIDVKVEAGRTSGALSCLKRLRRRVEAQAPAKDPVTFGSDLAGDAVTLPTDFPAADTEFWTSALTVPEAGTITAFRLKTGDGPTDLPLRFSVIRPRDDGSYVVVTTTNPVYPLQAHDAGVHTYPTSALSFRCCTVRKGDVVTVDNSGTTQKGAYVWFARSPGATTCHNTGYGDSQNAGNVWTCTPHEGYEVLLQVVLQPG